MSVFVEARTDPFAARREQLATRMRSRGRSETPVRRPLRGIQIKEDSYAIIRVLDSEGRFIPVIDAAGELRPTGAGPQRTVSWTNFLVQSVSEQRQEKQQIVETFGDSYIFFFGESPRMLQVQGILINSADFNWRAEWWENYERYFRGTRLVERAARLYLIYDEIIVEGYLLNASASESAQNNSAVQFNFTIYVTGYSNVSLIGDPNFPAPQGSIDYTDVTAYGEQLRAFEDGQNVQTASTVDAVRRANQTGIYLGAAQMLSDVIRRGITSGDVSVSAFLQRAQTVITGTKDVIARSKAFYGSPSRDNPNAFARNRPLRTTFQDNTDEFISSDVSGTLPEESPFSKADQWLQMDQRVDTAVSDYFNPAEPEFWDLMGRAGRASQEIASRASNAAAYTSAGGSTSRLFSGPATATNPVGVTSGVVRDTPFGVNVFSGGFGG